MYIGNNVKNIRQTKKLKGDYVALKAKMSKTTFNRIENNMREAFEEDIAALETALGVSREELTKHTSGTSFHNTNGKNYINQQQNFADKETITSRRNTGFERTRRKTTLYNSRHEWYDYRTIEENTNRLKNNTHPNKNP